MALRLQRENLGGDKVLIANYNANLPDNIIGIINKRGLKQGAIAERAGYTKQQFSDMMNGRRIIKPCDVLAISNALGVSVNDLYAASDREEVG